MQHGIPRPISEKLSDEEKNSIRKIFLKKIFSKGPLYLLLAAAGIATLIYLNTGEMVFSENTLALLNITVGTLIAFSGNLLVLLLIDYNRETGASEKEIICTKIINRKGNKIILGNKTFSEKDFLFSSGEWHAFSRGDEVKVERLAGTKTLLSIKKI